MEWKVSCSIYLIIFYLAVREDGYVDKEELRRRLREHAKTIKVRGREGQYTNDNENLEK